LRSLSPAGAPSARSGILGLVGILTAVIAADDARLGRARRQGDPPSPKHLGGPLPLLGAIAIGSTLGHVWVAPALWLAFAAFRTRHLESARRAVSRKQMERIDGTVVRVVGGDLALERKWVAMDGHDVVRAVAKPFVVLTELGTGVVVPTHGWAWSDIETLSTGDRVEVVGHRIRSRPDLLGEAPGSYRERARHSPSAASDWSSSRRPKRKEAKSVPEVRRGIDSDYSGLSNAKS
jgi:hypothetical protein